MINLDPSLVNQGKISKQRRRRYFRLIALPCVMVAILALSAARQPIYNALFNFSLQRNETAFSTALTQLQLFSNFAQPAIAYYNQGIIDMRNSNFESAEKNFTQSLKENPDDNLVCNAYVNLSLSVEKQADREVELKNYDRAILEYTRASSSLLSHGCASLHPDITPERNELAQRATERLADKRSEAIALKNELIVPDDQDESAVESVREEDIQAIRDQQKYANRRVHELRNQLAPDYAEVSK